jgi:hypothetical protein
MLCLRTVLFAMVESNLTIQKLIQDESQSRAEEVAAWNETTKTILNSVSSLLASYMENVDKAPRISDAWSDLLDYLEDYFSCGSHALGASVFTTISGVISKATDSRSLNDDSVKKTANVWRKYFDHRHGWRKQTQSNQEAFVAYAEAFKAIYRLNHSLLEDDLASMLSNLEACVVESDEVAYSSDLDHLMPLQGQVLECLALVHSRSPKISNFLVKMLSRLVTLPYDSVAEDPGKQGPTFVAVSK